MSQGSKDERATAKEEKNMIFQSQYLKQLPDRGACMAVNAGTSLPPRPIIASTLIVSAGIGTGRTCPLLTQYGIIVVRACISLGKICYS